MNPNEYFQELKPKILRDEAFMANLRTYASTHRTRLFGNPKVTSLGAGRNNIHFRIGRVGDIWLATRDYLGPTFDVEDRMQHPENYIAAAVRLHNEGKRVPIVCGAVKAENEFGGRYFLLLEDLYHGGTSDFEPAPKNGRVSGKLNGEDVFHDFDTDEPVYPPTKFLEERLMLVLKR